MSKISWETAPEDTQFYSFGRFRKYEYAKEFWWDEYDFCWVLADFQSIKWHKLYGNFEMRPYPAVSNESTPKEEYAFAEIAAKYSTKHWIHKGLPHAGTICECDLFDREEYVKVKVLDATNGKSSVCITIHEGGRYGQAIWGSKFRPIKSDREKWCDDVRSETVLHFDPGALEAIFDKGFSKND